MGLKSKTFSVYKGEGGLQEARYFLRSAVGLNGELILRVEGVLFQPNVVHLTIYYLDQEDLAIRATSPGPGAIIGTGITVNHYSLLFSNQVDANTIQLSGFIADSIGLPANDINLESNKYVARVRLTGNYTQNSGFHSLLVDSSKLKYTNGDYIQTSAVVGYSIAGANAAYPGEQLPYSATKGRRGEVDIAGVIVSKGTPPNEILDAFMRQSKITKDRIITSTTVALTEGHLYCFFVYFATLEPQLIYCFPYNYSLALDVNAPSNLTFVFREAIDEEHLTTTTGLFVRATSYSATTPVAPADISLDSDKRTVHVSTTNIINGAGIYDIRILGIKSLDGTIKTQPDIYSLTVGPLAEGLTFTGTISGASIYAGTGLTGIGNFFHVRVSGDGSIVQDLDGIRVGLGSIGSSHIKNNTVVRSVSNGSTTIRDDITLSGFSGVYANVLGNNIQFSSVSADNSITITANGIKVNLVGTGNISGNTVVRSITNGAVSLRDNIYLSGLGTISFYNVGNTFLISGSATAGTTLGRSGIITDPVDPSYLRISGYDNSIGFIGDGIGVNIIGSGNISGGAVNTFTIANNTVVRSLRTGSTLLQDSIYMSGKGSVSVSIESNGLVFSGTTAGIGTITGGNSGVILDPVNSAVLRVSGADNSIGFLGNGIKVNLIGTGNISGSSVVRALVNAATTLMDNVYLSGYSGVNLAVVGNGLQVGAVAANSSITVSAAGIAVGTIGETNFAIPYPISGIRAYDPSNSLLGTISGWMGEIRIAGNLTASFDSSSNRLTISYAQPAPPDSTPSYIEAFLFGG